MVELLATSDNTGFAVHFVHPNASHFAKPENVICNIFNDKGSTMNVEVSPKTVFDRIAKNYNEVRPICIISK